MFISSIHCAICTSRQSLFKGLAKFIRHCYLAFTAGTIASIIDTTKVLLGRMSLRLYGLRLLANVGAIGGSIFGTWLGVSIGTLLFSGSMVAICTIAMEMLVSYSGAIITNRLIKVKILAS